MIVGVLAGGRATRFGKNKLLYEIDGIPLIEMVLSKVKNMGYPVYIITGKDTIEMYKRRYPDVHVVEDRYLIGPIGGILTALMVDSAIIVGGDMPLLNTAFLKMLVNVSKYGEFTTVPWHSGGLLEPLHAVYSVRDKKALEKYVMAGGRSIQTFLKEHTGYIPFHTPAHWMSSFANVNTKGDIASLFRPAER